MCTTTLHLRIDEDLKNQASEVFENLGMDLPTAIRIFLHKSVMEDGMPFELRNKRSDSDRIPCSWTLEELKKQLNLSMNEIAQGKICTEEEITNHFMDFNYGN